LASCFKDVSFRGEMLMFIRKPVCRREGLAPCFRL
jgi:hypothetical protein